MRAKLLVSLGTCVALFGCGETSRNPDPGQHAPPGPGRAGGAGDDDSGAGGSTRLPTAGGTTGGASGGGGSTSTGGVLVADGAGPMPTGGTSDNGSAGDPNEPDVIDAVKPTPGCGQAVTQPTGQFVRLTLPTMGMKDAQCADSLNAQPKCGPWSLEREYFVWLPPGYDPNRAYPLVVQGTGCGGTGKDVYPLSSDNTIATTGVGGSVIRVGLTPPPVSIGHGTNPGEGCYDDKEGDDSVDFVFYEQLLDKLRGELCFDQNRIYVAGNSSGAWLANELACKYAGTTEGYAVRAVAVNGGGLPTDPKFRPTCSEKPIAGLWVREMNDAGAGFDVTKFPIAYAMKANGCSPATDLDSAVATGQVENFPIGAGKPDDTCKRIKGCAEQYPLVVCSLPANGHTSHDDVVNPAFAMLFKTLAAK